MNFVKFKKAVQTQFKAMEGSGDLFVTEMGKDELWELYLASFPAGTNPLFRERTEHDCQCCKQFIRAGGSVVAIVDSKLVSVWDINVGGTYQVVADALSKAVKGKPIADIFLHHEANLGTDHNFDTKTTELEPVLRFDHFHHKLDAMFVNKDTAGAVRGNARTDMEVLRRSLMEISKEAAETVLELIEQNSLYRGQEHISIVGKFLSLKRKYEEGNLIYWKVASELGIAARFRNTVIGTLMADISDGVELDKAVGMFEAKVAPENYKRPSAVITQDMIKKAQDKVAELGIEVALPRRYAQMDDITINNVLFADRSARNEMGVFDEMASEVAVDPGKLGKVEEVSIDNFVEHVRPTCTKMELLFENRHVNNLMSVIAPVNAEAPNILKWDNNFSWSYNGEVTDSIKERVKRAGGNVEGVLRCSLSWFNSDDLDIHIYDPSNTHIFYGLKSARGTSGNLDVDMNAGGLSSRSPVENITWTNKPSMLEGVYNLKVHNYSRREDKDTGFEVEIEYEGKILTFHYSGNLRNNQWVDVVRFDFSRASGLKVLTSIESRQLARTEWGINTQSFVPVRLLMQSPNHWDGHKTGNKHWFFILENCLNEGKARGLYNEFLDSKLIEHRKVFEVLGSKMKTEESGTQLSGLGFSSTKRDSVLCKVTGSFTRVIKITF